MKIRVVPESEDGLDAIRDAYETLCAIFDAAEEVEIDYGNGYTEIMLRLPGSGEMVDTNDLNALNGLERWLMERYDMDAERGP